MQSIAATVKPTSAGLAGPATSHRPRREHRKSLHVGDSLGYRFAGCLCIVLSLSSCTPGSFDTLQRDLTRSAQEQLQKTLAGQFISMFGKGVGTVIADLARPGGYLANPLVRILLPPPLGLAFDLARTINANPQASLLEVLMNQAAEKAVPGASPILQAALSEITPSEARALLNGGKTALTDYLKAKTTVALHAALTPLVAANLAASGAQQTYGKLSDAYRAQTTDAVAQPPAPMPELVQHVTGQAVAGVFKMLGERELLIRENLDTATGGVLQGMEQPAVDAVPAQETPAAR